MVAYHVVNTDRATVGRDHPIDVWFDRSLAAVAGDAFRGRSLAALSPGDVCFMYANDIGVIGVGDVEGPWLGIPSATPMYYTGPGHLKDGEAEYQIGVRWWADLRGRPISAQELAERGLHVTPHAVRTIGDGKDGAEQLVLELRQEFAGSGRSAGDQWTEESFFIEAHRRSPIGVTGLRRLLELTKVRGNGLQVHWGAGDHLPRFIVRQVFGSEDLISGWASGHIGVQTEAIRESLAGGESVAALSQALGDPSWGHRKEPTFAAAQVERPEVDRALGDLLDQIADGQQVDGFRGWALLANPDLYRIDDAVRELREDTWVTAGREMRVGDRLVIWRGRGRKAARGIVALGEVTGPAEPDDSKNPYWVKPPDPGALEPRVRVRYLVPGRLPLLLDDHSDLLGRLSVSRARGGTVFRLARAQWESLVDAAGGWCDPALQVLSVGVPYIPADEMTTTVAREAAEVDPDKVDRGVRAHGSTQNALAAFLRARGIEPRSPGPGDEAEFDLAWSAAGTIYVAEVKSVTPVNEEKQLRLGLGQVLRYRHLLARSGVEVKAALVAEREPKDSSWVRTCSELGVVLTWPGAFDRIPV